MFFIFSCPVYSWKIVFINMGRPFKVLNATWAMDQHANHWQWSGPRWPF